LFVVCPSVYLPQASRSPAIASTGTLVPGMDTSMLLGMNVTNTAPGGPDLAFAKYSGSASV
jgi:hypothetical protein